jgi:hypothetical protein
MNKKEFLTLVGICVSTLLFSSMIKHENLPFVLIMILGLFFVLFLVQKNWILQLMKALLVPYLLTATFMAFIIALYYLFPKEPKLYPTQDIGGTREIVALVLSLIFSAYFAWEIRKNGERKTILIYIGGIALCLLPSLLKQIV